MKITKQNDTIEFINFASTKKRDAANWRFIHISYNPFEENISSGELSQLVQFHFTDPESSLFIPDNPGELVICTNKKNSLIAAKLEKDIYENYKGCAIKFRIRGFDADGLDHFMKIFEPYAQDVPLQVTLRRFCRPGNSIIVLDDDLLILKQIERALSGMGHVLTMSNTTNFEENYIKYAPNIFFCDIHIGKERGNEILKRLTSKVDPYAYVIMISSDTKESTIVDIKTGGARGFITKPFNSENLFKHSLRAPTISTLK